MLTAGPGLVLKRLLKRLSQANTDLAVEHFGAHISTVETHLGAVLPVPAAGKSGRDAEGCPLFARVDAILELLNGELDDRFAFVIDRTVVG